MNARNNERGQAMVEFSLIFWLFLVLMFICIRSGFWVAEEMTSVANVSHYATILVSNPTTAAEGPILGQEAQKLRAGMFGTQVDITPIGQPCPTLSQIPTGHAYICVMNNVTVTQGRKHYPGYVKVAVMAQPALFGPFGGFTTPIDVQTYVKSEGFAA